MYKIGDVITGTVCGVRPFGVFVKLDNTYTGLVHISEITYEYVNNIYEMFNVGEEVKVKVIAVNEQSQIGLSIKQLEPKVNKKATDFETRSGFAPLKQILPFWIKKTYNDKMKN